MKIIKIKVYNTELEQWFDTRGNCLYNKDWDGVEYCFRYDSNGNMRISGSSEGNIIWYNKKGLPIRMKLGDDTILIDHEERRILVKNGNNIIFGGKPSSLTETGTIDVGRLAYIQMIVEASHLSLI